ncbi:MAG: hypothetical protein CVU11_03635 [Bacteroidetes bacterium HGW-Bacteroidetes-6]|jgi:hypothetical protein|nr:MAG: hypothetical protein CVU11_03635 [Bacteroidetes bacterium HGW-Bacteroidetes-6]
MKTKNIRNIVVLGLMLLTVLGCSKFEDGPKISLRSVVKRIYGVYKIDYFSKNGTDLTDYWNQYYDITFDFHKFEGGVYPDIYGEKVTGFIDSCGEMKGYSISTVLTIVEGDEIKIGMHNYFFDSTWYPDRLLYPIFTNPSDVTPLLIITRLTNDEMWVKHTNGSDEYIIHFKE